MSEDLEIKRLIGRVLSSFDRPDWEAMQGVLCPTVRIDYSDLRGDPPKKVSASDYVATRRETLGTLTTPHLAGNFDVSVKGHEGTARVSCVIFRRSGERVFDSHALYEYAVSKVEGGWRISGIKQT